MAKYRGTPEGDSYYGTGEADVARGYEGDDYLRGGGGDDILYGDDGDDILRGGEGTDRFYGGSGFDRVSFAGEGTQGVIVDLEQQVVLNDGYGNREQLYSIEAVGTGTRYADAFYGNDQVNFLLGGQGDTLFGFGGDDEILADGMAGTQIDGGGGRDLLTLVGYHEVYTDEGPVTEYATRNIVVDLSRGLIKDDGFGVAGRVYGIEDFACYGAPGNRITGSDGANRLSGSTLIGLAGDDELSGNGGDDRLRGDSGGDVLIGNDGKDQLQGGSGADRFYFAGFAFFGFMDGNEPYYLPADSGNTKSTADRILDFSQDEGDLIDVSAMDAFPQVFVDQNRDDSFVWRGTDAFTGAGAEARYQIQGGSTFVYLDVGGDDGGLVVIRLEGAHVLTSTDFVL